MSNLRIVPRTEWGAKYGRGADASWFLPWGEAVIHTEAGAIRPGDWPEITEAARLMSLTEQQHVQAVERYHSVTLGWNGVGYSFLISRDGTIFEGRGWGRQGAHTETRNSNAVGICFLGHGDVQSATGAQWAAARWLIGEGIRLKKLKPNPIISGHRQYSLKGKTCPGTKIYPLIQQKLAGITGPGATPAPAPTPTPTTPPVPSEGKLSVSEATVINKRIDTMRNATILLIEDVHRRINTLRNATLLGFAAEGKEREKAIAELEASLDDLTATLEALRNA